MTNSAFVISILLPFWGFTCGKGSTNFISLHYLCPESEDRLHLSIKNERVHFILHSVCTIFVANRRILSMNGQFPSTLLEKAVNEFAKLPGVGRKTAMRLVLHLLRQDTAVVEAFGNAIVTLKHEVKYCKVCHNISDTETCRICSSPQRDAFCGLCGREHPRCDGCGSHTTVPWFVSRAGRCHLADGWHWPRRLADRKPCAAGSAGGSQLK